MKPTFNLRKIMLLLVFLGTVITSGAQTVDTVYVEMAAINQPFMYNRLGTAQPTGMVFALTKDLRYKNKDLPATITSEMLGQVRLRSDKRPRPIVLRANEGDILKIKFTNLLASTKDSANTTIDAYDTTKPATVTQLEAAQKSNGNLGPTSSVYPLTDHAGVHIMGTEMLSTINSDGSYVGKNQSSLAAPGETKTYTLIVPTEGVYMLYSTAAPIATGGQKGGQLSNGLFGSLNVEPKGAEWYRSQVSEDALNQAIEYYIRVNKDGTQTRLEKSEVTDIYATDNIFPYINYDATYSDGTPILKMYKETSSNVRELVYTDLTAIITGPNRGDFVGDGPSFFKVPASPDRRQSFREVSIHYHESPWTVQAFPIAYTTDKNAANINLAQTIATGNDAFSINYGSGGIGPEIYANRIGVGPMAECEDCAYEEFFLSSWSVGDPAMVVDIPANASGKSTTKVNETLQYQFKFQQTGTNPDTSMTVPAVETPKATRAIYADDPSNVYHSYMNDHTKFRLTHAGKGLTHVHHQHAHQWLHTPDSDNSHYLDSQTINPGSSYTLEMVYDGSGNLNKTVGDQIFHCHFYPHFAAGMWALWRVHDVLELGTELDSNGAAATNSRALPDGEIKNGTAIPGVVPIPQLAMAPIPAKVHIDEGNTVVDDSSRNPGYPFFIPGLSGSRAPNPPMDYAKGDLFDKDGKKIGEGLLNGGLPRSVVSKATVAFENHSQYDWTKIITDVEIIELPNDGTPIEKVAMAAHAQRNHHTLTPSGKKGIFNLNGRPPVPGAPYADPAVNLEGEAAGTLRTYKGANIQLDVVFNKKGWHYPQQRIISLWGDVNANISGIKAPEPFFMRANSKEYIEYWHTNLVPQYYELDDFQVRTPTDIIGQHIHLVKFDVTSSDGAANGFNYQDGTLAPDLVRERINAINNGGKRYMYKYENGKSIADTTSYTVNKELLAPHYPNPIWGKAPQGQDWRGAQTTIQRWYADPLLNNRGEDRTLRTVFTHDHFGPSTHQQIGLYGGLLIEPQNTNWYDPTNNEQLSTAFKGVTRTVTVDKKSMKVSDGGPTSWQANIVYTKPAEKEKSYREFMLEFQDTQQAYLAGSIDTPDPYPIFPEDYKTNSTAFTQFKDSVNNYTGWMDAANAIHNNGYPELISFGFRGTYSMNYRNEPLPLRASQLNSNTNGVQSYSNPSTPGGDLANVYSSRVTKPDAAFNTQPAGGTPISSGSSFKYPENPIGPGMQPKDPYTPLFRAYENDRIQIRTLVGAHVTSHWFNVHGVKWLFEPSFKNSGYRSTQNMSLSEHFEMNFRLPVTKNDTVTTDYLYQASADAAGLEGGLWGLMRTYNKEQKDLVPLPNNDVSKLSSKKKDCGCPDNAPRRFFDVAAFSIDELGDGKLTYNTKLGGYVELDALVYIGAERAVADAPMSLEELKNKWQNEPMVLRANAGDCIVITLTNAISKDYISSGTASVGQYNNYLSASGKGIQVTSMEVSTEVGLHAELLSYDVSAYDGSNIGLNKKQTVAIGESTNYEWYAGQWEDGKPIPVEFGSILLSAPDRLEQYTKGLFGALIIEPKGATWKEDEASSNSANVYDKDKNKLFREFVFQFQDNITVNSIDTVYNSTQKKYVPAGTITYAINYKSEPVSNLVTNGNLNQSDLQGLNSVTDNGGLYPATPNFTAEAGQPLRLRMLHTGGLGGGETFTLHGHSWQEEPYTDGSTVLGYNPMSQQFGFRDQFGPLNYFDLLIDSAGGANAVTGDYLYNDVVNLGYQGGVWGVMTVTDGSSVLRLQTATITKDKMNISGTVGANPVTGRIADEVILLAGKKRLGRTKVGKDGVWKFSGIKTKKLLKGFIVEAVNDGTLVVTPEMLGNVARKKYKTFTPTTLEQSTNVPQPGDTKPRRVEVERVKSDK